MTLLAVSTTTTPENKMACASTCAYVKEPAGDVKTHLSTSVLETLQKATAFCFDVDSTFCEDESIDEIAAFLGVGEAVAEMTSRAMGGSMLFQDALKMRLDLMAISSESMTRFLAEHPARLSPGIRELVALLHSRGVQVYLVSGGFRLVIHPIADALNIPQSNVFANTLLFNTDGSYSGFDPVEFTSRSGGKREAVAAVAARDGHETIVMVGDGATDAEARAPGAAALFVGYGGVVYREAVAQKADWYITRVQQLIDALESKSSA